MIEDFGEYTLVTVRHETWTNYLYSKYCNITFYTPIHLHEGIITLWASKLSEKEKMLIKNWDMENTIYYYGKKAGLISPVLFVEENKNGKC